MTDAIHHSEVEFQLIRGDKPILRGTPDGVWVLPNAALIAERKFGFKPVQGADANLQLRCYITMVADVYPKEHYFGILCQPRISFKPHTVYYRRQDIERAREEIYAIYDACFAPDAPRRASVEGCQYCTAKAVCPEFREWIGDIERIRSSPVLTWTDAQMEMFETRRTMAQKFIEDTHKAIVAIKAANPERLPNFRLKEGASVRTVSDLIGAWTALAPVIGNDQKAAESFSSCCEISIGALENLIWQQRKDTDRPISQKDAKRLVNEFLGGLIELRRNRPSLVKDE